MTTNKNNKKQNAARKLIPAIGMLTVSAMMLSSSTYAWFTMNKEVQVNGMELRTRVSGNLLICQDNVDANYKPDTVTQARAALLEPVSSINATTDSFFYTLDAAADGSKAHAAASNNYIPYAESAALGNGAIDKLAADGYTTSGAGKASYDANFNGENGYHISGHSTTAATAYTNAYGYVDYTFYLKATADADSQAINMTRCNLVRSFVDDGDSEASDHVLTDNNAWRIAVFAEDITSGRSDGLVANDTAGDDTNLITILGLSGADYFVDDKAVSEEDAAPSEDVVNLSEAAVIDTLNNGETAYYKVVVRVWLEGEDEDCFSGNYSLKEQQYKLDLAFELGKGTAVEEIGTSLTAFSAASSPAIG
jgi:hypothetical protein